MFFLGIPVLVFGVVLLGVLLILKKGKKRVAIILPSLGVVMIVVGIIGGVATEDPAVREQRRAERAEQKEHMQTIEANERILATKLDNEVQLEEDFSNSELDQLSIENKEEQSQNSVILRSSNKHELLHDNVISVSGPKLTIDKVIVKLIGVELGDTNDVGAGFKKTGIEEAFTSGFSRGLSIALNNIGETKKRDVCLALYFEFSLTDDISSPRDVQKPIFKLEVEDDKMDKGIQLYNSYSSDFLEVGKPKYGLAMYAVYSDSEKFYIQIEDNKYELDTSIFN